MKKGLCFLIIIAFILFPLASCMPPEPELRFALINDGTAYEVSGGRAVREVIIPAIYNGLPVSAIAEKGFYHQGLTGIVIPHSVTNIGAEAFSYCGGLWRITVDPNNAVYRSEENCLIRTVDNALIAGGNYGVIPDGTSYIWSGAFSGRYALPSVRIPGSVTGIGKGAFQDCRGLKRVTFAEDSRLASIGESAFDGCVALQGILIPDGVTEIGDGAFGGCTALQSISIPEGVRSIGAGAFNGCAGLVSLYMQGAVPPKFGGHLLPYILIFVPDPAVEAYKTHVGWKRYSDRICSADSLDGGGFIICENVLVGYFGDDGAVEIPSGVTAIAGYAFYNRKGVTEVTVPDGVTVIGSNAFSGCADMTAVSLPGSLVQLQDSVFSGCVSLTDVFIPDGVGSIAADTFRGCVSLTIVRIPDSVKTIGGNAFRDCGALDSITLPAVTNIGARAFENTGIWNNTPADSVVYADVWAVGYKGTVTEVSFKPGTVGVGNSAFSGCQSLTNIALPGSMVKVERSAFNKCGSLISLTLPAGVTVSGSVLAGIVGSFSNCPNLTVYIDDASRYGPYNSVNYYWPDSPVLWNCTTAEDENGVYVESFIKKSSSGIRFPSENFNAPYRKGYIFGGWSAVPGGPKVYSAAQLAASFLSIANNTTLYAIWIEK